MTWPTPERDGPSVAGWSFDLDGGKTAFDLVPLSRPRKKLYGPSDKDGTQLFKPGPEAFTVFSEAYATVRLGGDHGVHIGRQSIDLPYMGKHDLRMIPNTFNAVTIGNKPGDGLAYMAGYVDSIKYKDSDEFTPMSEAAGAEDTDKGLTFWGFRYRMPDQSVYGLIHQRTPDLFHTTFAKAEKRLEFSEDLSLWADVSYTQQSSIGEELIGDFKTHLISTRLELVSGDNKFRVGASRTDDGGDIKSPMATPPIISPSSLTISTGQKKMPSASVTPETWAR